VLSHSQHRILVETTKKKMGASIIWRGEKKKNTMRSYGRESENIPVKQSRKMTGENFFMHGKGKEMVGASIHGR